VVQERKSPGALQRGDGRLKQAMLVRMNGLRDALFANYCGGRDGAMSHDSGGLSSSNFDFRNQLNRSPTRQEQPQRSGAKPRQVPSKRHDTHADGGGALDCSFKWDAVFEWNPPVPGSDMEAVTEWQNIKAEAQGRVAGFMTGGPALKQFLRGLVHDLQQERRRLFGKVCGK
jgi:hypothetical protein